MLTCQALDPNRKLSWAGEMYSQNRTTRVKVIFIPYTFRAFWYVISRHAEPSFELVISLNGVSGGRKVP